MFVSHFRDVLSGVSSALWQRYGNPVGIIVSFAPHYAPSRWGQNATPKRDIGKGRTDRVSDQFLR